MKKLVKHCCLLSVVLILTTGCPGGGTYYKGDAREFVKVTNHNNIEYDDVKYYLTNTEKKILKTELSAFGEFDPVVGYVIYDCTEEHIIDIEVLNSDGKSIADTSYVAEPFTKDIHSKNFNFQLNKDMTFTVTYEVIELE